MRGTPSTFYKMSEIKINIFEHDRKSMIFCEFDKKYTSAAFSSQSSTRGQR